MEVQCTICLESCAASGTSHAPYSTPYGHVTGKECLDKFKKHLITIILIVLLIIKIQCLIIVIQYMVSLQRLRIMLLNQETHLPKTEIIDECIGNESDFTTQLKKTSRDDCTGIMNDKIWMFEKDGISYELASETDKTIISYSIDPKFRVLIVLYSNKSNSIQEHSTSQSFAKYKIIYESDLQKYYTEKIRIVQNIGDEIPKSIIPSLFAIKNSNKPLIYHGIFPNIENNKLEVISFNNTRTCEGFKCVGYEILEDTSNCLGVTFVGIKNFFFKNKSIRTFAIIHKNKVVVMDISYTATY
uniref:SUN domain-containing protein n=1 Tax=Strongyloides venezuelensis TaxID=75913 RepID=A0A0K0FC02_STRVS